MCMRVCVCVRACVRACVCVCVCFLCHNVTATFFSLLMLTDTLFFSAHSDSHVILIKTTAGILILKYPVR